MNILGIDTSSKAASVALYSDGKVIGDCIYNHGKTHSAYIGPMIKSMITACNVTMADIDYYACGVGPGSFTGVRIGITMAKTFSLVEDVPCVGVDSLNAAASFYKQDGYLVIAAEDARRERVFACGVMGGDNLIKTGVFEICELCDVAKAYNKKVLVVGGGAFVYEDEFKKAGFLIDGNKLICGSSIIEAALPLINSGKVDTAVSLMPMYLLKSQAEQAKL